MSISHAALCESAVLSSATLGYNLQAEKQGMN